MPLDYYDLEGINKLAYQIGQLHHVDKKFLNMEFGFMFIFVFKLIGSNHYLSSWKLMKSCRKWLMRIFLVFVLHVVLLVKNRLVFS